ncbi:hypothetical protein ACET3Z_020350 [Daucus carota]
MYKLGILSHKVTISLWKDVGRNFHSGLSSTTWKPVLDQNIAGSTNTKARNPSILGTDSLHLIRINRICRPTIQCMIGGSSEELSDEDDELCPVNCVREFKNDNEFLKILEKAKETKSLVVVDFYRTACGSCKYIEQGFTKLCKGSGVEENGVIFLKHNVIDEYDEQSEVAERLRIKAVPLFHFYKDGVLLEAFPTRDKERIIAAIDKYTAPATQDL